MQQIKITMPVQFITALHRGLPAASAASGIQPETKNIKPETKIPKYLIISQGVL